MWWESCLRSIYKYCLVVLVLALVLALVRESVEVANPSSNSNVSEDGTSAKEFTLKVSLNGRMVRQQRGGRHEKVDYKHNGKIKTGKSGERIIH